MNKVLFFSLLVFLIQVFQAAAQQLPSIQYTTLDGLANNAVRTVYVDSRGLVWIGTEHGISMKENGKFQSFYMEDGLAFGSCWAIAEDTRGQMWFGSYGGGITKFDGEKFTSFPLDNGLIDPRIRHLFPYKDKVFVGTENGISIIDITTDIITSIEHSILDSPQSYVSGFFEHDRKIYYATYGMGVYSLDPDKPSPTVEQVNDHKLIYALKKIGSTVYASNKGHVDEFLINELVTGKNPMHSFGQSIVWDYFSLDEKTVYMASWGIYANNGGLFSLNNNDFSEESAIFSIDSKTLNSISYNADKQKLYIGSLQNGLYAINLNDGILYHALDGKEVVDFSFDNSQKAILHEDGFSLFTDGENMLKNLGKKDFKNVSENYLKSPKSQLPKHEDDFFELDFDTNINDILFYELKSHHDYYWISSNIGVFELSSSGAFLNYLPVHTYKMGFTPDGKFIETNPYGGVRIYNDVATMDFEYFPYQNTHSTPTQVSQVITGKKKTYFSSVFEGLFDWDGEHFYSYKHSATLPISKIKQMHLTKDEKLVLATEFEAIYIAEDRGTFEVLETIDRNKILGKTVLFLESYQDYLLIGTEKGLNIYHNGNVRVLDDEQGLIHMLFKTAKVDGDLLYIGTSSGYYSLHLPDILQIDTSKFQLAISQVSINQIPVSEDNYSWFTFRHKNIKLAHGENMLLLKFKPVGHKFPEKLRYRYRLTSEDEWSPYSADPQIFFSYLPSGIYDLEVDVYDQYSGQNTKTSLIKIQVLRPYYQNPWIISLIVIALVLTGFLLYRNRVKKLRNEEAIRQGIRRQLAETKLEALRSQMNPHMIFNAINSMQYFILKSEIDRAMEFMGKFSKLIRKTLNNSSKSHISLEEEMEYIQAYIEIENERKDGAIYYELNVEPSLELHKIGVPPMLIQPIVENVFAHAFPPKHPNPTLIINFELKNDNILTCTVEDNGTGIQVNKREKMHESKGIDLVNRRISLLMGKEGQFLHITSSATTGTKIEIEIPLFHIYC